MLGTDLKKVSFSSLSNYKTCPAEFKAKYLENRERTDGGIYGPLGSLVHSLCEKLIMKEIDKEKALSIWDKEFEELVEKYGMANPETYKEEIKLFLEGYDFEMDGAEVEKRLEVPIKKLDIMITGYVDLIIDNKVKDWKTGAVYSGTTRKDKIKQLYLYAALLKIYGKAITHVAFIYPRMVNISFEGKRSKRVKYSERYKHLIDKFVDKLKEKGYDDEEANVKVRENVLLNKLPEELKEYVTEVVHVDEEEVDEEKLKETVLWATDIIKSIKEDKEFKATVTDKHYCMNYCGIRLECDKYASMCKEEFGYIEEDAKVVVFEDNMFKDFEF